MMTKQEQRRPKTKELAVVVCHKSINDKNALATMCGRDEEPRPPSKHATTTSNRLPIRIEQVWLGFDSNVN
jgi:hypothetical protein